MYCWNCGTKLPEKAGFCFACGKGQAEELPETAEPGQPATILATSAPPVTVPMSDWRPVPSTRTYVASEPPNRIAGFLSLGAAILVIIGSFAPWVTVTIFIGSIEVNGMDGDGKITLWCGLGAVALLAVHLFTASHAAWTSSVAALVLLVSGVIGVIDWRDLNDVLATSGEEDLDFGVLTRVGWGLQVMTIASFAGALLAGIQGILSFRR